MRDIVVDWAEEGPSEDRIRVKGEGENYEYHLNLPPWTPIETGGWNGPPGGGGSTPPGGGENGNGEEENGGEEITPTSAGARRAPKLRRRSPKPAE